MNSLLLKGGLVLDPSSPAERIADVRIAGNEILEVAESLPATGGDERVIDASGAWICPGFIDLHTHLRDFGQSDREDIATGTMSAASGGYTSVVAMANTDPPIDNTAIFSVLLNKIAQRACIDVLPVACVTRQMLGAELTNMAELADLGACAFSDDGMPLMNMAVLRRALEYAKLADRIIISHAEDKDLAGCGVIDEGLVSCRLGLPGYPSAAESAAIAREIEVARQVKGRLHFAHVSCAASVDLIRRARAAGVAVTGDVTPHHLLLTVDQIDSYDTHYKMNPPLRTAPDVVALVEALKDGTLSAIATDHAPHTKLDKSKPFDKAPFGVIGLETAFPLTYEKLVLSGVLDRLALIRLLTSGPAEVLGLPQPVIKAGNPANIAVVDPQARWTYQAKNGHSRSINSPFNGRSMTGKILLTIYQGNTVYKDKDLLARRMQASCPSL